MKSPEIEYKSMGMFLRSERSYYLKCWGFLNFGGFFICICLFFFIQLKDNKWHKSVFEVITQQKQRLPIIDVAPFDIGSSEKEFQIEAGCVCFVW